MSADISSVKTCPLNGRELRRRSAGVSGLLTVLLAAGGCGRSLGIDQLRRAGGLRHFRSV